MKTLEGHTSLAAQLESSVGKYFHASQLIEKKSHIVEELHRHISDYSANEINKVVETVFTRIQHSITWTDFLRYICWWLPSRWIKVTNNPGVNASTMLLLTDGSIMCQASGGVSWKRLVPDANGSYINGTWHNVSPMNRTRLYYASAVLADGRVLVSGGEYSDAGSETNDTEIYDPVLDTWTTISAPAGWTRVGDAACCVLADGRLLMGNLDDSRTAIFNPSTNTWTAGPNKGTSSSEESWVLLADGSVLTVRCNSTQQAEKYIPASNTWVSAGTTPVNLVEIASSEIGAAIALNDGRALVIGATGKTAIYTPPVSTSDPGSWAAGPDIPQVNGKAIGCKDSPSCLLTNGKVLISGGPVDGTRNNYLTPTYFFEFDGTSIYRVADPPNNSKEPYQGRMMLAPTGNVLYASASNEIYAYSYCSSIDSTWRPHITSVSSFLRAGGTYTLHGQQINGLSQAVGYGDDAASATNYPLVRIRNKTTGHVFYCRTFDHSTMAIATGTSNQSTTFHVPYNIELGDAEIYVVANGIASAPYPVDVWKLKWPWLFDELMVNHLIGSLADGPLWVLGPNGPIPVDPWGPKYSKAAQAAWRIVFSGIRELQALGNELNKTRLADAQGKPVAVDTGDEEEEKTQEEITADGEKKKKKASIDLNKIN
jgi:Kelch motif protein